MNTYTTKCRKEGNGVSASELPNLTDLQNPSMPETGIQISRRSVAFGLGDGLASTVVYVTVGP